MSYNIANAKLWKPFFTKSFLYPGLASVQEKEPKYLPIDNQYAINLEDKYVTHFWWNDFYSLFIFTNPDRMNSYNICSLDSLDIITDKFEIGNQTTEIVIWL